MCTSYLGECFKMRAEDGFHRVFPAGATRHRVAPAGSFLPSVPGADHANDQRSIQRSPSRSQFEAICFGRASFSDVAKT